MINLSKRLFILSFAMHAVGFSIAAAQETIAFEPAEAALTGKLLRNYVMLSSGQMLKGNILHLEQPITIEGNENSENKRNRKTVRNIQQVLVVFEDEGPEDDVLGSTVQVLGKLYNEPSDPHHTNVLMKVVDMTVIEASSGGAVGTFKTHKQ